MPWYLIDRCLDASTLQLRCQSTDGVLLPLEPLMELPRQTPGGGGGPVCATGPSHGAQAFELLGGFLHTTLLLQHA